MKLYIKIFILFFILYSACVEPYDLKINTYDKLLVVDGLITNDSGPYTIRLSRTSELSQPDLIAEFGATVILSDNLGNSETLTEQSTGKYVTLKEGIQGIVGRKYKLYIKTRDNEEYESDFVELLKSIQIDSLYSVKENQQTDESYIFHEGYQFYVKIRKNSDEILNLYWEPLETYEYNAQFPIEEYYDLRKREFLPYPNPYEYYTCYRTNPINDIFFLKINNFSGDVIKPLFFVSADTKKLNIKYSLLVMQYNVNDETYSYQENLKKLLNQGNDLYNIQPFRLIGNVKNINDPNIPVLGFFTVAGVSKKRIFVSSIPASNTQSWCVPNPDHYTQIIGYGSRTVQYATRDQDGVMGTIGGSCIDCRQSGGTLEKPDYWDEN